jgi:cysteine desulfuration protein SufE
MEKANMPTAKIDSLKTHFSNLPNREALYQKIIDWGKKLEPFDPLWKVENNRVSGCQSLMYLYTKYENYRVFFYAASDALISAGLAAILIEVYNEEAPEAVLLHPPLFLQELGIPDALTPGRANGLASLYLKMKQEALKFLVHS